MSRGAIALRLILFLLTFTLEVKVHAEEGEKAAEKTEEKKPEEKKSAEAPKPKLRTAENQVFVQIPEAKITLQTPEGCLSTKINPCAFHTSDHEKRTVRVGEALLVLDQGTTLIRLSESGVRLVTGQVWVKSGKDFSVASEFGSGVITKGLGESGEMWASREKGDRFESIRYSCIRGEIQLEPRGSTEKLFLASGLENSLGAVDESGQASRVIPMALDLRSHLVRWARLYSGTVKQFSAEAADLRETWQAASRETADMHRELFDRKIASIKAAEDEKAAARQKVEAHDRAIRDEFRRRFYNP